MRRSFPGTNESLGPELMRECYLKAFLRVHNYTENNEGQGSSIITTYHITLNLIRSDLWDHRTGFLKQEEPTAVPIDWADPKAGGMSHGCHLLGRHVRNEWRREEGLQPGRGLRVGKHLNEMRKIALINFRISLIRSLSYYKLFL